MAQNWNARLGGVGTHNVCLERHSDGRVFVLLVDPDNEPDTDEIETNWATADELEAIAKDMRLIEQTPILPRPLA